MMKNSVVKIMVLGTGLCLLAMPVLGFKEEDLEKLRRTNECIRCDLSGADLSYANLQGAVLLNTQLDFTDLTEAKFRNTVMPDGQRVFKDC